MKEYAEQMNELYAAGTPTREIAKMFGCSTATVVKFAREAGIEIRPSNYKVPVYEAQERIEPKTWNIDEDLKRPVFTGLPGLCKLFPDQVYNMMRKNKI